MPAPVLNMVPSGPGWPTNTDIAEAAMYAQGQAPVGGMGSFLTMDQTAPGGALPPPVGDDAGIQAGPWMNYNTLATGKPLNTAAQTWSAAPGSVLGGMGGMGGMGMLPAGSPPMGNLLKLAVWGAAAYGLVTAFQHFTKKGRR